jgi:hypothetical protein
LVIRPIGASRCDAVSPYGYPGPLLAGTDDESFVGAALEAAMPSLRAEGVVSLFVRSHPLLNPSLPAGVGTVVHHGDTVAIDLTLPAGDRWLQLRRNHRTDIVRALQSGHRAWFDDEWVNFETFKRLYHATMRRRSAAEDYFFDDAYFDGLREALGDGIRLCVVEIEAEIIAATLFTETCGIVEYHLMGVDEAHLRFAPAKLMFHAAWAWAADRHDTLLHLGGGVGGANDSLMHFKAGFSPLRFPFFTLRVVLDDREYARLARECDPAWEADASDNAHFPAYRRPRLG